MMPRMNWPAIFVVGAMWLGMGVSYVAAPLAQIATSAVMQTTPYRATSANGNKSATIVATNTFQKLFNAAGLTPGQASGSSGTSRRGCTIQNNSTHAMNVGEGLTVGTATLSNTMVLAANGVYNCGTAGVVLDGEIDITGTSGDAFYAVQF